MKTKMSILSLAVGLAGMGCMKRPYAPAGGPDPLNVSGIYEMSESLYSNSCGPGVFARKGTLRVKVEHTAGGGIAKIVVDDRYSYDAVVRADGNFTVAAARGGSDRGAYSRTISGNFTRSGMFARVMVDSLRPLVATGRQAGAADQSTRDCKYQLRWDAKRL